MYIYLTNLEKNISVYFDHKPNPTPIYYVGLVDSGPYLPTILKVDGEKVNGEKEQHNEQSFAE